jgi:hypothetical protein
MPCTSCKARAGGVRGSQFAGTFRDFTHRHPGTSTVIPPVPAKAGSAGRDPDLP